MPTTEEPLEVVPFQFYDPHKPQPGVMDFRPNPVVADVSKQEEMLDEPGDSPDVEDLDQDSPTTTTKVETPPFPE